MRKLYIVLLVMFALPFFALADGPMEEETSQSVRDKQIENMVNKPQRTISTVGPVPINTAAQAPVVPGSNGTNIRDLSVIVSDPQGRGNRNQGTGNNNNVQPTVVPTTYYVPPRSRE